MGTNSSTEIPKLQTSSHSRDILIFRYVDGKTKEVKQLVYTYRETEFYNFVNLLEVMMETPNKLQKVFPKVPIHINKYLKILDGEYNDVDVVDDTDSDDDSSESEQEEQSDDEEGVSHETHESNQQNNQSYFIPNSVNNRFVGELNQPSSIFNKQPFIQDFSDITEVANEIKDKYQHLVKIKEPNLVDLYYLWKNYINFDNSLLTKIIQLKKERNELDNYKKLENKFNPPVSQNMTSETWNHFDSNHNDNIKEKDYFQELMTWAEHNYEDIQKYNEQQKIYEIQMQQFNHDIIRKYEKNQQDIKKFIDEKKNNKNEKEIFVVVDDDTDEKIIDDNDDILNEYEDMGIDIVKKCFTNLDMFVYNTSKELIKFKEKQDKLLLKILESHCVLNKPKINNSNQTDDLPNNFV